MISKRNNVCSKLCIMWRNFLLTVISKLHCVCVGGEATRNMADKKTNYRCENKISFHSKIVSVARSKSYSLMPDGFLRPYSNAVEFGKRFQGNNHSNSMCTIKLKIWLHRNFFAECIVTMGPQIERLGYGVVSDWDSIQDSIT